VWLKRLCDKYELPIAQLERMPLGAFHREIAMLLADTIVSEARRLRERTSDQKERRKLDKEWRATKQSTDWLDRLIVERVEQDARRP
jgi:hypothetical protein